MAKSYISTNDDTKRYTIALLSLLDELTLIRYDDQEYTIPLYFGQSSRRVARKDSVHNKPYPKYSQVLPAMHLTILDLEGNEIRQTNRFLKKRRVSLDNGETQTAVAWNDVNMDINFNLHIRAKNIEELLRIVEYITTIFVNDKYYIDVKHIMYDEPISTPIILNTKDLNIEMNEDVAESNREVECDLAFTVKGIFTNNIQSLDKTILSAHLKIWKEEQFENLLQEFSVEVV